MRIGSILLICIVTSLLTACSWSHFPFLYKPEIQQGNVLTDDRVSEVKEGMNQDQVNYLLGTPTLTNIIDTEKVQYVYTFQSDKKPITIQKMQLTFDHDRLISIEK